MAENAKQTVLARARPEDALGLTAIAMAAKRHWGYPERWIRRWESALTVTSVYIRDNPTYIVERGGETAGFYALQIRGMEALLDHLWVLPSAMGEGVGRGLFTHAERLARASGAARLKVVGDPHAEGLYRKMGARVYGRELATMDGRQRFLLLMEKDLA